MARVLTIEDDETTAREIVAELTSRGFEVEAVADGREGLVRAAAGGFDAITLDRMLPGLDGLAVLRVLRESGVETPVLMISALAPPWDSPLVSSHSSAALSRRRKRAAISRKR